MMLHNAKTLIGMAALLLAAPLAADVREGVEAWSRGDYGAAVSHWQGPASEGDPDALFNLGQAYRLGRGVPSDAGQAEDFYAQAAAAGHLQAADTYGLMLFQDGRREQALPYVMAAARRGDPRARYLLGIAHFNGDLVPQNWERAYAMLTLANGEGLPQAASAIAQMDEYIPLAQRQEGAALARQLEIEAQQARAAEFAGADFGMQAGELAQASATAPTNAGRASGPVANGDLASGVSASGVSASGDLANVAAAPAGGSARVPQPIPTTAVSPSVASAREAVEQAREATGMESPQAAGASFANAQPQPASSPPAQPSPGAPAPQLATAAPVAQAPAPVAMDGPWRVQLGAFSVRSNAEGLWQRLASRPELAGASRLLVPAGQVTKLQAGGFASRAAAQTACNALKQAGTDCLVTRN